MVIDCDRCEVRGDACGDCVVGVLLGVPGVPARAAEAPAEAPSRAGAVHLDGSEQRALSVLADQGLVPRLRLVAAPPHGDLRGHRPGSRDRDVG